METVADTHPGLDRPGDCWITDGRIPPRDSDGPMIMIGSALLDSFGPVGAEPVDLGELVAEGLAVLQPGPAGIARLASLDTAGLDARGRIEALLALETQRAWLDALQQRLLAEIAHADTSADRWCIEEVGAALRLSPTTARTRLHNAVQLTDQLPAVHQALSEGRISSLQATAITETSYTLPDAALSALQATVLRRADQQSLQQTKQSLRRAAIRLDPDGADLRHSRARADRHIRLSDAGDGMAWLSALLPAADATACYQRLDEHARSKRHAQNQADANANGRDGDTIDANGNNANHTNADGIGANGAEDDRTLDQLRADHLVTQLLAPDGTGGTARALTPAVSVVISADTLLGKNDDPAWLDRYGPITADTARELAHDPTGTWRRLLIDPVTGHLLDYGTTRYRPPPAVREHVRARDATCTFPHCSHQARHCDLDHVTPYPAGPTNPANLSPADRRHHRLKTHSRWKVHRHPDGATTWTSPLGREHTTRPPQRWTLPDDPPF